MRILHYTLGFSPYRSGGLVRYATDLMEAQIKLGHKVVALYPGGTSCLTKKCYIKFDNKYGHIPTYEIVNPLPVPLMYGLKDVTSITSVVKIDVRSFEKLLKDIRPEVIHLHTLMGLPLRFLELAKEGDIKIVFTSHDYFGLCLKVNFIDETGCVCCGATPDRCKKCNDNAKSTLFLQLRNAKFIATLTKLIKLIRR